MNKQTTLIAPEVNGEELNSLKQQLASLAEQFERLQHDFAQQSKVLAELTAKLAPAPAAAPQSDAALPEHAVPEQKPVSPDVLVVIAAAVSAFLGKKIRIRSARMLQSPYEIVNPWSQQGRVSIQASHSLRWER